MSELFLDSKLVRLVRSTGGGKGLLAETIKFVFVILTADAVTNRFAIFVIDHGIEPLASMSGIWLIAIGLLSVAALAYLALWEDLRPCHAGVSIRPWQHSLRDFVLGYVGGAAIMSAAVIVATLIGGFDLAANLHQAHVGRVTVMALIYVFQAFGEEVLYRGACMMCMARKNAPIAALIVSSALFSLHHHFNPGYGPIAFVNLFLLAVLLGASVFVSGRIWIATAIHAAWNFFQGNVFGVNVSGAAPDLAGTIFTCTAKNAPLVTGGQMGLEGSLVTTVALVVALAACAWLYRTRAAGRTNAS